LKTKTLILDKMKIEEQNSNEPQKTQLNIDAVISNALPCPFCGEKPTVDKNYMPSTVEITCNNHDCQAKPSVYENVQCVENKGDTVTYSPMFEWHWQSVLDKWNTRHCL
jgi:hypothetical protein